MLLRAAVRMLRRGRLPGALLRAAAASAVAADIDRTTILRVVRVLGVEVDRSRCSDFIEAAQPHVLRLRGVRSVRSCGERSNMVLLDPSYQDEACLPDAIKRAVGLLAVSEELHAVEVTLGYDELSAQEVLRQLLPHDIAVPTGHEQVGHIVHLNLRPEQRPHRFVIGQVLLDKLRPRIRTVVNKADEIRSEFRTLPLELLAGDDDYAVTVQHGAAKLSFQYDRVYWSSRLQTEHERVARSFAPDCVVWDLFAGVGPFAVLAAQRGVRVLANDLNPDSCRALLANVAANRLRGRVHVYNLDAAAFARAATESVAALAQAGGGATAAADGGGATAAADGGGGTQAAQLAQLRLPSLPQPATRGGRRQRRRRGSGEEEGGEEEGGKEGGEGPAAADAGVDAAAAAEAEGSMPSHILLNLPADSISFLGALNDLSALLGRLPQPQGQPPVAPPMVHCYSFTRLADPEAQLDEARARVADALGRSTPPAGLSVRTVRSVAPGKEYVCVEFPLPAGLEV